jgi:hypothetical protein
VACHSVRPCGMMEYGTLIIKYNRIQSFSPQDRGSDIPVFHHSNIPIWAKALNFHSVR